MQAEIWSDAAQALKINRLYDIGMDPKAPTFGDVPVLLRRGQNHNRNGARPVIRLQSTEDLQPADLGQVKIEENQPGQIPGQFSFRWILAEIRAEDVLQGSRAILNNMNSVGAFGPFKGPKS